MLRVLAFVLLLAFAACGGSPRRDVRGFLIAAEAGDTTGVKDRLADGVAPDDLLNVGDRNALYYAAINVHPDIVKILLDAGADPRREFEGLSLKSDIRAFRAIIKKAESDPEFKATYKKQDGTLVDLRSVRVADDDFVEVMELLDAALAKPIQR